MKGTLCCIFNYAPLYRQAVYRGMDEAFDVQFCFGDEPIYGRGTQGIEQMDISNFRRPVRKIRNRMLFGRHPWRAGFRFLPLRRRYSTFLVTGDFNWAYLPFLVLSRVLGKRVYAWGHGLKSASQFAGARRLFYKLLTGYFFYSEGGAKLMQEAGYPKEKCHVIYNSLVKNLETCNNGESEEGRRTNVYIEHFGNNDPVLLFSGRLQPAKRVDMLIDAVSRLNAEGLGCNLIIIGDGPEREKLEALISALSVEGGEKGTIFVAKEGNEVEKRQNDVEKTQNEVEKSENDVENLRKRIWFYGACYEEKRLAELFYNADLCVSPGNVGLTAIHAMQYGLPVVSHSNFETQMPEYKAIVEGETGALFKEGDFNDLCRTIRTWLETHTAGAAVGVQEADERGNATPRTREETRNACYKVIAEHWTAEEQLKVLKSVLG